MAISEVTFDGLKAVELTTEKLRVVGVTQVGPRIAFFGLADGNNLLFWDPEKFVRKGWNLYGGHRVWVTRPGADESEETYSPDNEQAEVEMLDDGFRITGAENPFNCTRRGVAVRVLSDDRLKVDNFVTNTGDMLFSAGVWALTCTVPKEGTIYAFLIGDGSAWDCFNLVMFRSWGGFDGAYNDPQISFTDDLMLINPQGRQNKRIVQCHAGICVMSDPARRFTFAKKVNYDPAGYYPLGANMAIYIGPDNFMVEMETMGAQMTLKPGESAYNIETWLLKPSAVELKGANTLIELFG